MDTTTGTEVAMKFFGYTRKAPRKVDIVKEIGLMKDLNGAVGVIRLIGTINDSPSGYSKYYFNQRLLSIIVLVFSLYLHYHSIVCVFSFPFVP